MSYQPFSTSSGRKLYFDQLHIRTSDLGFLMGSAAAIRTEVLRRLPAEVTRTFGQSGLLLQEPPDGRLPTFTFFVKLHSYTPVKPPADYSSLVVVWFADALPDCLPAELATRLQDIEWDKYAKDGDY